MTLTTSARIVLILLGLSLGAMAVTGEAIYSHLAYLWLFLLAGNFAWALVGVRGIVVQRVSGASRAEVGQTFEEQFVIHNTTRVPRLWLAVRDESALPGRRGSQILPLLAGGQTRQYRTATPLAERGLVRLGPTVITSSDPFGLFPVSRRLPPTTQVLVYPKTFEVRSFPTPAGLLPGGDALRRRTQQITPSAATIRDYEPGDPLRRIHWPSTARRASLMVKEFELDPLAQVWLFVDAEASVNHALPATLPPLALPPTTEDYAASIAASLAKHFLRRERAVGLVCSGASFTVLSAERSERQLSKIFESLALLKAQGRLSLLALTSAQGKYLPRGSVVVLITPSTDRSVALAVDHLQRRGLRPVAVLLDAASFGGRPGTASLAADLKTLGAPTIEISNGDDLSIALSQR
jgi:uncharacterized protein (DUF58 family)